MNVFDCAIKMEEEAKLYYEALAAQAEDRELRNLFTMLAAAEQEHKEALVQLQGSVDPQMAKFTVLDRAACLFKPLLAKREAMAQLKESPDGYQIVVAQEEKGVELYQALAAQTKDDGIRQILLKIADEERRHLSIVENIYSFVESPKTFLAWGEFSNLQEY